MRATRTSPQLSHRPRLGRAAVRLAMPVKAAAKTPASATGRCRHGPSTLSALATTASRHTTAMVTVHRSRRIAAMTMMASIARITIGSGSQGDPGSRANWLAKRQGRPKRSHCHAPTSSNGGARPMPRQTRSRRVAASAASAAGANHGCAPINRPARSPCVRANARPSQRMPTNSQTNRAAAASQAEPSQTAQMKPIATTVRMTTSPAAPGVRPACSANRPAPSAVASSRSRPRRLTKTGAQPAPGQAVATSAPTA